MREAVWKQIAISVSVHAHLRVVMSVDRDIEA
jgi:hypothetical protein